MSAEERLKCIEVRYFASLRDQRGVARETVATRAETPLEAFVEADLGMPASLVRFAVNGEFVSPESPLRDGDELCFIPPVAGG
jgi:molybdopterin synthase sulfur carrier subunit